MHSYKKKKNVKQISSRNNMKGLTNEAFTGSTNGILNKVQAETPPPTYTTELHILPKVNASHVSIVYIKE